MALKEPKRFRPRRVLSFMKGLIKRDDDSMEGYVSDLKNMNIEGNTVEQRRGSKLLLPNTNYLVEWSLMGGGLKSVTICGCEFLVGVDQNGKFYAVNDTFVECRFEIYSFMTENSAEAVQFSRGDRFWLLDGTQFIYVVNNYYDIFRIDKRGTMEWWFDGKTYVSSTAYRYKTDARDVNPVVPASQLGKLLLDVIDVTHKEIESLSVIEDLNQEFRPLRGTIKACIVNNANQYGPWKEVGILPDYRSCFFSLYPGLNISGDLEVKQQYKGIVYSTTTETGMFVGYSSVPTISNAFHSNGKSTTTLPTTPYDGFVVLLDPSFPQFVGPDIKLQGFYLYCDKGDSPAIFLANQYIELIKVSAGKLFLDPTDKTKFKMEYVEAGERVVAEITERLDTSTLGQYYESIPASGYTTISSGFRVDVGGSIVSSAFSGGKAIYKLEGKALDDLSSKISLTKLRMAKLLGFDCRAVLKVTINSNVNLLFEDITDVNYDLWKHIGFDLWESKGTKTLNYSDMEYDNVQNKVQMRSSGNFADTTVAIDKTNTSRNDGQRFAVWNNDKVLRTSQRAFVEPQTGTEQPLVLYEKSITGMLTHAYGFSLHNVPVMSMDKASLEAQIYPDPLEQFLPKNIESIDINQGTIYMYDGNRIYISDESLVPNNFVELNSSVRFVARFYDGILAFTTDTVFRINKSGDRFFVPGGSAAKVVVGFDGMVAAIHKNNDIALYQIYYREGGAPQVRVDILSEAIDDFTWSDDAKMAYCDNTLYVGDGEVIYGFKNGGWVKQIEFEEDINNLTVFKDRLIVNFSVGGVVLDLWGLDFTVGSIPIAE